MCFIFFFSSISHRVVSEICAHQLPNQYEILSLTFTLFTTGYHPFACINCGRKIGFQYLL